jgi:hypothetical protein
MSKRGRQLKTSRNSAKGTKGFVHHETLDSPRDLNAAAQVEYQRLLKLFQSRGTIDRFDLSQVAQLARVSEKLDRLNEQSQSGELDYQLEKMQHMLTSQYRGLLRDMGVTLMPSRSVVRTVGQPTQNADPIEALIKLHG